MCPSCKRAFREEWRARARSEIVASNRTWMATFTFRPDVVDQARNRVLRASDISVSQVECEAERMFQAMEAELAKELTLYWKRLRKAGARVRYLLVAEAHKSGVPHYHALVHEYADPVLKKALRSHWLCGFTTFKLVDVSAANYVTKYMVKSMNARVRASVRYGEAMMSETNEKFDVRGNHSGFQPQTVSTERSSCHAPVPDGAPGSRRLEVRIGRERSRLSEDAGLQSEAPAGADWQSSTSKPEEPEKGPC